MEKHEYLKIRESSLNAPKPKIEISDEDLLCKIIDYVEQAYYVFKKNYHKPINKTKSKIVRKKKVITPDDINKLFVNKLTKYSDVYEATELFKFIVDLKGYNGLPTIVSDKEFAIMQNDTNIIYRGSKNKDFTANLLADKINYHYGYGVFANGIYASPAKALAEKYSEKNNANILTFLLTGRSIDIENLRWILAYAKNKTKDEFFEIYNDEDEIIQKRLHLFYDAYNQVPENIKEYVDFTLNKDKSLLALFLGYDYVTKYEEYEYPMICVLNRASMVVSKSEYGRFVKGSKYDINNDTKSNQNPSILEESQPQ